MKKNKEKAKAFHSLHNREHPLLLYNVWSAGFAKLAENNGALAIGTSSWSIATDHGYEDGENIPFSRALKTLKEITRSVSLPVTFDMEGGYSTKITELIEAAKKIIQSGAVGVNFEDQVIGGKDLYSITTQSRRINALKIAGEMLDVPYFINARSDVFFKSSPQNHTRDHLEEALARAHAYGEAGANGFFVPGLEDLSLISELCKKCPLPVNIMLLSNELTVENLVSAGVSRISYGPAPYLHLVNNFKNKFNQLTNKHNKNI